MWNGAPVTQQTRITTKESAGITGCCLNAERLLEQATPLTLTFLIRVRKQIVEDNSDRHCPYSFHSPQFSRPELAYVRRR